MKISRLSVLLLLACLSLSVPVSATGYPFNDGEKLSMTVHYKWGLVNADIAQLNFNLREAPSDAGQCYEIKTTGNTNKFFDKFFKVRYIYESRFLKSNLNPVYFHRETYENDYWAKNTYTWSNGCRTLHAKVTKSTRPATDTTITKNEVIHDVIGMFYKLRSMDLDALKKGGSQMILVALDRNTYDVNISYVATENRKSAEMGTFKTDKFVVMIRRHKGGDNLSEESQFAMKDKGDGDLGPIYFWLSADEARVPLFFQAPLAVGAVNGRITSMSGTKVPVTPIE